MTKVFCDICGKEVEDAIELAITMPLGERQAPVRQVEESYDICEDCQKSLMQFFKTRGKE